MQLCVDHLEFLRGKSASNDSREVLQYKISRSVRIVFQSYRNWWHGTSLRSASEDHLFCAMLDLIGTPRTWYPEQVLFVGFYRQCFPTSRGSSVRPNKTITCSVYVLS